MLNRGIIIKLDKKVCKVAYIWQAGKFMSKCICKTEANEEFWDSLFDAAKEFAETTDDCFYREITDTESIERLYNYEYKFLGIELPIIIFVEYKQPEGYQPPHYEVNIQRYMQLEYSYDEPEIEVERIKCLERYKQFIRECVGL